MTACIHASATTPPACTAVPAPAPCGSALDQLEDDVGRVDLSEQWRPYSRVRMQAPEGPPLSKIQKLRVRAAQPPLPAACLFPPRRGPPSPVRPFVPARVSADGTAPPWVHRCRAIWLHHRQPRRGPPTPTTHPPPPPLVQDSLAEHLPVAEKPLEVAGFLDRVQRHIEARWRVQLPQCAPLQVPSAPMVVTAPMLHPGAMPGGLPPGMSGAMPAGMPGGMPTGLPPGALPAPLPATLPSPAELPAAPAPGVLAMPSAADAPGMLPCMPAAGEMQAGDAAAAAAAAAAEPKQEEPLPAGPTEAGAAVAEAGMAAPPGGEAAAADPAAYAHMQY